MGNRDNPYFVDIDNCFDSRLDNLSGLLLEVQKVIVIHTIDDCLRSGRGGNFILSHDCKRILQRDSASYVFDNIGFTDL